MPPVNALLRSFFDALIPRICAGCNTKLELTEKVVCDSCLSGAEYAGDDYILQQYNINFSGSAVDSFTTLFIFRAESIVQKISHSFKYSGMFRNAVYAGELLGDKLLSKEITNETDFILPVPLHPLKKHERGYNQTDYICRGISRVTGLELRVGEFLLRLLHVRGPAAGARCHDRPIPDRLVCRVRAVRVTDRAGDSYAPPLPDQSPVRAIAAFNVPRGARDDRASRDAAGRVSGTGAVAGRLLDGAARNPAGVCRGGRTGQASVLPAGEQWSLSRQLHFRNSYSRRSSAIDHLLDCR